MAMEQRLEVKMLQKLILTPQLQQAIKLLQMPQLELAQTLNNELIENPFLEEYSEEEATSEGADTEPSTREDESNVISEDESREPEIDDAEAPLERLMGTGVEEYFDNRSYDGRDLGYFSPDNNPTQTFDQFVSKGAGLDDHLSWQLKFVDITSVVREAAEAVIGNLDENGYLQSSAEEIAEQAGVSVDQASEAIRIVQGFDPPGIAGRDLRECLLIQIQQLGLGGSLVEKLVSVNLKDLERRRYQELAAHYSVAHDEVMRAVKIIEGLEPRPGSGFSSTEPVYIKPDVYIVRDGSEFRILLNDDNIPNLRINRYYRQLLGNRTELSKDEREYLRDTFRSAVWLLRSLDHRNKTLYRVTDSILNFQREFFEAGVSVLKPQNLKDVARDLGMHESTISRATSNKYLSCDHGLFSFRYFFSSGLKTDSGTVSSTYVKDIIRKIIEEEDLSRPLSDQKIADVLKGSNIEVARRTVAKYREELKLAPQHLRKRSDWDSKNIFPPKEETP